MISVCDVREGNNKRKMYFSLYYLRLLLSLQSVKIKGMKEFVISEAKAETAILVGLITPQQGEAKTKEYLDELEFLADTAGAITVKRFTQRVGGPSQVTYVGKGKLEEIRQFIWPTPDPLPEQGSPPRSLPPKEGLYYAKW